MTCHSAPPALVACCFWVFFKTLCGTHFWYDLSPCLKKLDRLNQEVSQYFFVKNSFVLEAEVLACFLLEVTYSVHYTHNLFLAYYLFTPT